LKKILVPTLKITISVGIVWAAWRWFLKIENPEEVWRAFANLPTGLHILALICCCLNWGLESAKWKVLTQNLEPMNFARAAKGTLAGAAVSNVLPFRVGEYVGRLFFLNPENRLAAIFNSVFGSMCQMGVTLLVGIPAVAVIFEDKYSGLLKAAGVTLLGIVLLAGLAFYFLPKLNTKKNWLKKLANDIKCFTGRQILLVILLAALRYAVFAGFYVFAIYKMGIAPAGQAFLGVASVFMLQSFAPSMILTDVGVRTALPLIVFSVSETTQPLLLAVAVLNYLYNVLLPVLPGLLFIAKQKWRTS
jgi:hypothetical protein